VESPNAPLPTIRMDEGLSRDAEEAIARESKTFKDSATGQKKGKSWRKVHLPASERRASAAGGPISLTDDLKGRAPAGHG